MHPNYPVGEWLTSFYDEISIMDCQTRKQCHWLSFSIVFHITFDELTLNKESHTSCLFCNSLWRGFKKDILFTVCCFGTRSDVYKKVERKNHLLPVIDQMKFVNTLSDNNTFCSSFSHSDRLYTHQCYLLSVNWSDMMWSHFVFLTPCPWETGLISLLTLIY